MVVSRNISTGVGGEQAASDDRLRACICSNRGNAPIGNIHLAAGDLQSGFHTTGNVHHDLASEFGCTTDLRFASGNAIWFPSISIRPQLAVDLAALDVGLVPVLDCRVLTGKLATINIQDTHSAIFNGKKILLFKHTIIYGKCSFFIIFSIAIANQGRTCHGASRVCFLVTRIIVHIGLLNCHGAKVLDHVV